MKEETRYVKARREMGVSERKSTVGNRPVDLMWEIKARDERIGYLQNNVAELRESNQALQSRCEESERKMAWLYRQVKKLKGKS